MKMKAFRRLLLLSLVSLIECNTMSGDFQHCSLRCSNSGGSEQDTSSFSIQPSPTYRRGKQGPKGEPGERGRGCESRVQLLEDRILTLEKELRRVKEYQALQGVRSCQDLMLSGHNVDGIYNISIRSRLAQVYCDMEDGGWIVFQKRFDGSEDFNRNTKEYEQGFGSKHSEFWLGLNNLAWLTEDGDWELKVELESFDGERAYARYSSFRVGARPNFRLFVGGYSGTAGDSLASHQGAAFSTKEFDRDNQSSDCANVIGRGSFWYKSCGGVNLNAFVYGDYTDRWKAMFWYQFKRTKGLKSSIMKIRKVV